MCLQICLGLLISGWKVGESDRRWATWLALGGGSDAQDGHEGVESQERLASWFGMRSSGFVVVLSYFCSLGVWVGEKSVHRLTKLQHLIYFAAYQLLQSSAILEPVVWIFPVNKNLAFSFSCWRRIYVHIALHLHFSSFCSQDLFALRRII